MWFTLKLAKCIKVAWRHITAAFKQLGPDFGTIVSSSAFRQWFWKDVIAWQNI